MNKMIGHELHDLIKKNQELNSMETSCKRSSGKEEKLGIILTFSINKKIECYFFKKSCHLSKYVCVRLLNVNQICHTVQCHIVKVSKSCQKAVNSCQKVAKGLQNVDKKLSKKFSKKLPKVFKKLKKVWKELTKNCQKSS
jgi:hypothetical protein